MSLTTEELEEQKQALSLLSPEEREAMGMEDEEDDIIKTIAGNEEPDTKADAESEEDDDADDDADQEDDKKEDEGEDEESEAAAPEKAAKDAPAEEEAPPAETLESELAKPADPGTITLDTSLIDEQYQARLNELDAMKGAQFKKLMEGTIEAEDYAKLEAQYMRDRDAARDERQSRLDWFKEVNAFQNQVLKADGINYATDQKAGAIWDRWVKALAADPENAEKDGAWFLSEAHKMAKIQLGMADKPAAKNEGNAPEQKAPKVEKALAKPRGRAPDMSKLPPTLAGLPSAAESDGQDGGEFAHLEKLSGMEYERALARLTPEQKARYELED